MVKILRTGQNSTFKSVQIMAPFLLLKSTIYFTHKIIKNILTLLSELCTVGSKKWFSFYKQTRAMAVATLKKLSQLINWLIN